MSLVAVLIVPVLILLQASQPPATREGEGQRFVFPYFQGNGEEGVFLAVSEDGLHFEGVNDNEPILPAPDWEGEGLTRDPSIVYHDGVFHMVWTTSWTSRSIGYAASRDLVEWSTPKKIDVWRGREGVRNTWAPEIHWDPKQEEFFIIWASTLDDYRPEGGRTADSHGYDHRMYVVRTTDFETFTEPELFYTPKDPEHGVIDAAVARDETGDRWVMVIKNEMPPEAGGKNLRLAFSRHAQGPYDTTLGEAIVGHGTEIINRMGEGPSLMKVEDEWYLYWDAPGGPVPYCLATSKDLVHWENHSDELRMPVEHPRHGTIIRAPAEAIGWLPGPRE